MTEHDDLFGKEAEKEEGEQDNKAVDQIDVEPEESDDLSSCSDESDTDIAGTGIAAGEVRAVDPPVKKGQSTLLLGLLLLIVLIGGGYFFLNFSQFGGDTLLDAGQKKSMPKRYAIDKNIEVEVVEEQQVAQGDPARVDVDEGDAATEDKTMANPEPVVAGKKEEPLPVGESKSAVQGVNVEQNAEYQVLVGPYLSKTMAEKALQQLAALGYDAEMSRGRGNVTMVRLLEGVYQKSDVGSRLDIVRKVVKDAFKMPVGDKWAIYVGSFSDAERAERYISQLAGQGVQVTPVASEVELDGRMLLIEQPDTESARLAVKNIIAAGLSVKQVRK